jgi:hypothetical protein
MGKILLINTIHPKTWTTVPYRASKSDACSPSALDDHILKRGAAGVDKSTPRLRAAGCGLRAVYHWQGEIRGLPKHEVYTPHEALHAIQTHE